MNFHVVRDDKNIATIFHMSYNQSKFTNDCLNNLYIMYG